MKYAIALATVAFLAGCANNEIGRPLAERAWGPWLDEVGRLPTPRTTMSDEEAARLTARALELRERAEAVRVQLNAEPDRVRRFAEYRELSRLNDELTPIERQLTDAGRPSRARTPG